MTQKGGSFVCDASPECLDWWAEPGGLFVCDASPECLDWWAEPGGVNVIIWGVETAM